MIESGRPIRKNWCAWLDSNEHWTRPQRVPSAIGVQAHIGIRNLEDQAGFEPATGIASGLRARPVRPLR